MTTLDTVSERLTKLFGEPLPLHTEADANRPFPEIITHPYSETLYQFMREISDYDLATIMGLAMAELNKRGTLD